MLGIGLAGLGIHGSRYAAHLLSGDVPGARLAAVSRKDRAAGEAFAREHGVEFVHDPRDLAVHPEVGAVAIALLPDLHAGIVETCINAGRPVLVEKPLASRASDAARLAEMAEAEGATVMVAQTLRFDAVVQAIIRGLPSLGGVHTVSINQHFETDTRPWIDEPGRGGALLNTAVHGLDLLRLLTGAEPVSVLAETGRALTRRTEDILAVVVRLDPGGILGVVENARSTDARSGRIEVVGPRGMIRGDHIHRTLHRIVGRETEDLGTVPVSHTVPRTLQAFVECLGEGRPMPVTARDGRIAVEMVEAARLSAEEGRRVTLEEIRRPQLP
jgi:myo-inositol 2-dehydrogenase/D-chiro-inositol 1-dehydrogenase